MIRILRDIKEFVGASARRAAQLAISWRPICQNKIVFSSLNGQYYNKEPRLISEELQKSGEDLDIVWILPKRAAVPEGIRTVEPNSFDALVELTTARVWVDNCRKDYWLKKRQGQYYVQTWHGAVCLKKVEKDAQDTLHKQYIKKAINDSRNADLLVAETQWRKTNMERAFWYDGEIMEGEFKIPQLLDRQTILSNVDRALGLEAEERIVLYAPTFRRDGGVEAYSVDFPKLLETLEDLTQEKWKAVVRLHPNVAKKWSALTYDEKILDGTHYPQVNDLIERCDLLITDYSGVIFQGYRAGKAVMLYAPDYDQYISEDRGIYFDLKNLPSPFARDNQELIAHVRNFNAERYEMERKEFVSQIGYYENNASEMVAKRILSIVKGNEKER